jgi:hypothetical protein
MRLLGLLDHGHAISRRTAPARRESRSDCRADDSRIAVDMARLCSSAKSTRSGIRSRDHERGRRAPTRGNRHSEHFARERAAAAAIWASKGERRSCDAATGRRPGALSGARYGTRRSPSSIGTSIVLWAEIRPLD